MKTVTNLALALSISSFLTAAQLPKQLIQQVQPYIDHLAAVTNFRNIQELIFDYLEPSELIQDFCMLDSGEKNIFSFSPVKKNLLNSTVVSSRGTYAAKCCGIYMHVTRGTQFMCYLQGNQATFSPDEQFLANAMPDVGRICIHQFESDSTPVHKRTIVLDPEVSDEHCLIIHGMQFSPDGTYLAAQYSNHLYKNKLTIWFSNHKKAAAFVLAAVKKELFQTKPATKQIEAVQPTAIKPETDEVDEKISPPGGLAISSPAECKAKQPAMPNWWEKF